MKKIKDLLEKWSYALMGLMSALMLVASSTIHIHAEKKVYETYPYQELFTEGKEWLWCHYVNYMNYVNTSQVHYMISVKVDGAKVIDNIECKRLKIEIFSNPSADGCSLCGNWFDRDFINLLMPYKYDFPVEAIPEEVYVYEENRKIYFYRDPGIKLNDTKSDIIGCNPYFDLFMDLNISIGDECPGLGVIEKDELIEIDGVSHRVISGNSKEYINKSEIGESEWIEGIGATFGLSMHNELFYYYRGHVANYTIPKVALVKVIDNGKTIFDRTKEFGELGLDVITGMKTPEIHPDCNENCFDLHGRPIKAPANKQLYIRNGRVMIAH